MPVNPLQVFEKLDPELLNAVENNRTLALTDGVISRKFKILIAMAFYAAHGVVDGVRALAGQAIEAGASKEELAEVLRVALFLGGVGSIYTAGRALQDFNL